MKYDLEKAHYVVVTGIIVKKGKFLITRRSPKEKAFPGKWTVPGGKLEVSDYLKKKNDLQEKTTKTKTTPLWYNVLEKLLEREIFEETNLRIKNIKYITSLVYIRPDNIPTLIISLMADYASGQVKLPPEMVDFAWTSLKDTKKYDLIGGIYEELEMADKLLKGKKISYWKKG